MKVNGVIYVAKSWKRLELFLLVSLCLLFITNIFNGKIDNDHFISLHSSFFTKSFYFIEASPLNFDIPAGGKFCFFEY